MSDFMTDKELGELLNQLLEAERAGAKLLAAWLDELPAQSPLYVPLRDVQRDEASNCAVLIECLRGVGVEPSGRTGDFYAKALPIRDWRERLEFLNRGQAWVGRRIAAALPRIQAPAARTALQEMHDSHFANIERCKELSAAADAAPRPGR
jgi:HEAT repeat protein